MKRRLFNLLAAVSAVLCVVFLAFAMVARQKGKAVPMIRTSISALHASPIGMLLLLHVHSETNYQPRQSDFPTYVDRFGFRIAREPEKIALTPGQAVSAIGVRYYAIVPNWAAIGLCAIAPIVWVISKAVHRSSAVDGCCSMCGYDLRASKDRCPECGAAIPAAADPPQSSPRGKMPA